MSSERNRTLIAVVRRVAFAGLIILGAWLVLTLTRAAISTTLIEALAERTQQSVEAASELVYASDWSNSFRTGEPVAEMIGLRLGDTARLLVLGGLLSLAIAALFLLLGALISRVTERPVWLARLRSILRLVVVSGGVSIPVFSGGILTIVLLVFWLRWEPPYSLWWSVLFTSLLPVWLLIQTGHGEMASWTEQPGDSHWRLAWHLGIKMFVRLLKLVGAIIVVAVLVGPGIGSLLWSAAGTLDLSLLFAVIWVLVLIVVPVKLVAELIEIAYNHFSLRRALQEKGKEQVARRSAIPKAWLIFCLALVIISILVALVGPVLAPYEYNEINMRDRLAAPSAGHILGTDNLGRDIFSRLLYGLRATLSASLLSAGVLLIVAIGWATLAAYLRKANNWLGDTLEDLVMLPRDILCAFPWLVLLLLWTSMIVTPSFVWVALIISLVLLPRAVGMMREAYSSPPGGQGWLYGVLWSIPVMFVLTVAGGIVYTSILGYYGYVIPPAWPNLGAILSGEGRGYLLDAPWIARWPALVLILLLLTWVMAGDSLLERLGFRSKAVWSKVVE